MLGDDSEKRLWEEVSQYPLGDGNRLIVCRNAELLKRNDRVTEYLLTSANNPRTFLLLVSNEDSLPTEPTGEFGRPEVVSWLKFGARGTVIECKPFTQATAKHAVKWVQSKVDLSDRLAGYLLEHAAGNLRLTRDLCQKIALLDVEVNASHINRILAERARDSFETALIERDKKTALLAIPGVPELDYGRIIGWLDSEVDFAGMIHDARAEYKTPAEISKLAGRRAWRVPEVSKVAKFYNAANRMRLRKVLAKADEYHKLGVREGILEMLVSSW